jgi:hypothetical protein
VAVRAVLDTQVVVRGLLGIRRSACALVFEALADGAFTGIVSPYLLAELSAVLALPKLRVRYPRPRRRRTTARSAAADGRTALWLPETPETVKVTMPTVEIVPRIAWDATVQARTVGFAP